MRDWLRTDYHLSRHQKLLKRRRFQILLNFASFVMSLLWWLIWVTG